MVVIYWRSCRAGYGKKGELCRLNTQRSWLLGIIRFEFREFVAHLLPVRHRYPKQHK